ncbi:MAG TPA: hypothetical protein VGR07_03840 [Thermoanaerobaculia bacterium]|nr:hypothetical protein [Thermoanaerobaculia bacterium]
MSQLRGPTVISWWLFLLLLTLLPVPARADNCGSLSDCYGTILAAVVVALALAILLFFLWEALAAGALMAEAAGAGFVEGAAEAIEVMVAEGSGSIFSAGEMGEIIGWGTSQAPAAIAQTEAVTQALTTEGVEVMIENGLTREFVEAQLAKYEYAITLEGKLINQQLLPRLELMRRLLELWPP